MYHRFFLCSLIYVATIWCPLAQAEDGELFKVGAVLALTGPVSIAGIPMKNAMVMAKEDFDKADRIKLYFEDDGFLPRNTVSAVQKLMHQDKVDALVVFGTNQGLAVVNVTERKKIPLLSLNVNRNVVRDRDYSVLLMPSVEALTSVNISEVKRRGYKKVATVASVQDSCLLQQQIFEDSGVAEIVSSQEFEPSERAFREIATRIIQTQPDAVFVSTLPPQGSLITKRLRQLGFKGDFFGGIQTAHLAELRASGGALENGWVVSGEDRQASQYYDQYRRRFNVEPTGLSIYAYDSIRLIIEGLKTDDLNGFLHTVRDFDGIAGIYSADGHNGFSFKVVAKQFTANGYKYLNSNP